MNADISSVYNNAKAATVRTEAAETNYSVILQFL